MANISGQIDLSGVPHHQVAFCVMPGPDLTHMLPCSSLPEALSWLTMLQGDSEHRIQAGFLLGIFQHLCQEGSHPHTPLGQLLGLQCAFCACDRLLELLRAAGEAAEKQKIPQGHGEHNRVQSRAGDMQGGTAHSGERCWV